MKKESCENHEQTLLLYVTVRKGFALSVHCSGWSEKDGRYRHKPGDLP